MKLHRGQIIKEKITETGITLADLSRRLKCTRTTLYNWFEREDLPLEYILKIGEAIGFDFKPILEEFRPSLVNESQAQYGVDWKSKYHNLLEENHDLSKKYINLLNMKLKEFALDLVNS